jgi:hypothetical protein
MTKPDDIPQDIWGKADAVGEAIHGRHERGWVAWPLITDSGTDGPQKIVARALLAERERCAKTVEARADLYGDNGKLICREIASSIRAGETA